MEFLSVSNVSNPSDGRIGFRTIHLCKLLTHAEFSDQIGHISYVMRSARLRSGQNLRLSDSPCNRRIYKTDNFISDEVDANILIFGSSRAAHHYVPSILSDSLDMSCYNCGLDGNGIIYGYGKLKTITARYYPKIVILDIQPTFDLFTNDNCKYLAPFAAVLSISGSRFIILGHKSVRTLENDVEFLPVQFEIPEHSNG